MGKSRKNKAVNANWEELKDTLTREKWFSTYNLLEKKRFKMVQFFDHSKFSDESDEVSIHIGIPEWEIWLNKDGTWKLD